MIKLPTSKFRSCIARIIEDGESCLVTKHGYPVGAFISISDRDSMKFDLTDLSDLLDATQESRRKP